MNRPLYERDFHAWANEQAALLRENRLDEADIANIAEELAAIGRSERRELVNRLAVLIAHLLKWQFQPARRGNSWRLTLEEQRLRLTEHLAENPSLAARIDEILPLAYRLASIDARRETGLDTFPSTLPYALGDILDDGFLPED